MQPEAARSATGIVIAEWPMASRSALGPGVRTTWPAEWSRLFVPRTARASFPRR